MIRQHAIFAAHNLARARNKIYVVALVTNDFTSGWEVIDYGCEEWSTNNSHTRYILPLGEEVQQS